MRGNQLISILASIAITYALLSNTNAQTVPPAQPNAVTATQARISYQGRLTDSAGVPINSTIAITFKLYDDGGTPVYTTTRAVTPLQGLFTVDIGGGSDPDLTVDPKNILGKVASIGITVGSDPEMQPRQLLGTVIGHGNTTIGVLGSSSNFLGVYGHSINNIGVLGRSDTDIAIYAQGFSKTRPALAVDGAGDSAIAFRTSGGGIQVYQAGIDTKTPVFIHKAVTTGTNSNKCNDYTTVIDHPLTNNDPKAILIVTPNYGNTSAGVTPTRGTLGVEYIDGANPCGVANANRWAIYNTDQLRPAGDPAGSTDIPDGSLFNVLVIKS